MGKSTRRGAAFGAALLAGALVLAPSAMADTEGPGEGEHTDAPPAPEGDIHGTVDPTARPLTLQDSLPRIYRFACEDRVATALQAAYRTAATFNRDVAIIATSDDFPDAMAAAPLADALSAPVLLNPGGKAKLDDRVLQYLDTFNVKEVILVGGTQIFGASIYDGLSTGMSYLPHG